MKLIWDEPKRSTPQEERRLDFADAAEVFKGPFLVFDDDRKVYSEERKICMGFLHGRMVVVVYTDREEVLRIIPMRKANERGIKKYEARMGRSG